MLEVIIIALLVFIGVQEYLNRKERKGLLEMIMAKNLEDLSNLESRREINKRPVKEQDEVIPVSELDDDKFDKYIEEVNNQE